MANPEITSTNGASIYINFCSFGFKKYLLLRKESIDLFKKLKYDSHKFIMPSNSNIFLIPKSKSTISCIFETNKYHESMLMYIYQYWGDE